MAHIIVVGNEKGGAGKSTVTMHIATALARLGFRVGGIDLDLRQQTIAFDDLLHRQRRGTRHRVTQIGMPMLEHAASFAKHIDQFGLSQNSTDGLIASAQALRDRPDAGCEPFEVSVAFRLHRFLQRVEVQGSRRDR